jgi:hypothetical protein
MQRISDALNVFREILNPFRSSLDRSFIYFRLHRRLFKLMSFGHFQSIAPTGAKFK